MAEPSKTFKYCPSCGEQVYTFPVVRSNEVAVHCSSCGLSLELEAEYRLQPIPCVALADDDKFFRTLLTDLLLSRRMAQEILPVGTGSELLSRLTERLVAGKEVGLVILDLLMPDLDGAAAARGLRALERGLRRPRPIPIIFLSGVRCDEAVRRLVARTQPALYLNKAADSTPDRLAVRMEKMVAYLLWQAHAEQAGRSMRILAVERP
ncbi:MAG: response regulator [candidate division NC10 bacterium]|nr:response regulator [candidate division NC10 bacterium]